MSYLYCSPLPQTLCAACGEQCDRLSLTQLLPWAKSVNGRASEVDVSLCLMVHPPSLRLRSLLSSNFQGQGTDVEAEEEAQLCSTLHLHYTPAIINGLSQSFSVLCSFIYQIVLRGRARSRSRLIPEFRKLYFPFILS